jgi:uracil-DNA glycosylase
MRDIDRFLEYLQAGPREKAGVFNPWADHDDRDRAPRRDMPRVRRGNMAAYLEFRQKTARVLLLGEAPSHRGCRFTGIAFCSETELVHKRDLVAREALPLTSRDAETRPQRERSAHVIWDEIEHAGAAHAVVLWNAFPWHPHGAEGVATNRKPRTREVEDGREALERLLACFSYELSIFAVGKVAEAALAQWPGQLCKGYLRHPAQGGEAKFREGFRSQVAARL